MDRTTPEPVMPSYGAMAPGPDSLRALLERVRSRDQQPVLHALAQEVVPGETGPGDTVRAVVWATSDVARAVEPIAAPFRPAERDRPLEGRALRLRLGQLHVLVEQPAAAGALAAYVSRYGDGLAALYLERPRFAPPPGAHRRPPRPLRTPLPRRGWLLPHEWPWGPFLIVLEHER